jgi:hypothetical protein
MSSFLVARIAQNHTVLIEGVQVAFLPSISGHWQQPCAKAAELFLKERKIQITRERLVVHNQPISEIGLHGRLRD